MEENQVDIGGHIQFTAAELAHADHDQVGDLEPGERGRDRRLGKVADRLADFLERGAATEVARHLAQDHALAELTQSSLERAFVLARRTLQRRVHLGARKRCAGQLGGERRTRRQPTGGEAGNASGINQLRHCGLECRVGSSFPI